MFQEGAECVVGAKSGSHHTKTESRVTTHTHTHKQPLALPPNAQMP